VSQPWPTSSRPSSTFPSLLIPFDPLETLAPLPYHAATPLLPIFCSFLSTSFPERNGDEDHRCHGRPSPAAPVPRSKLMPRGAPPHRQERPRPVKQARMPSRLRIIAVFLTGHRRNFMPVVIFVLSDHIREPPVSSRSFSPLSLSNSGSESAIPHLTRTLSMFPSSSSPHEFLQDRLLPLLPVTTSSCFCIQAPLGCGPRRCPCLRPRICLSPANTVVLQFRQVKPP
jgi:hypothetical protein